MATATAPTSQPTRGLTEASARRWFAIAVLSVAVTACLLAGFFPLGFSIVTVFLFAAPHNWMEARFFMQRMPARWGKLRGYFSLGLGGVGVMTVTFAALPWIGRWAGWSYDGWLTATACWNSCLVLWVMSLVELRSRQNPRRNWSWVHPLGLALIGLNWLWPVQWGMALVYVHPLVALWFLDRELKRTRPHWRTTYHCCLAAVGLLMLGLWWRLADAPSLPGDDALAIRISQHAGGGIFSGISTHLLVATHTFLEMLHYGVWLVAIPLLTLRSVPWKTEGIPLVRRSHHWRWAISAVLCLGALAVLVFWSCFLADYPLTRDVYFTVAIAHVLAEVPFLLRSL